MEIPVELWQGLGWPLIRLVLFVSLGLLIGNFIESLNWTHAVARLASPLVRAGHLSETTGASFSLAFFSSVTANTMLAEAYDQGRLERRELIFANLFNSLPTYFLHLPTMFFLAVPLIGATAFVYVGLTVSAAFLRTAAVLIVGRLVLPARPDHCVTCRLEESRAADWSQALRRTWRRFRKRIRRILLFTVPIYILTYLLQRLGAFDRLEEMMAGHLGLLAWLDPRGVGIVVLQLTAETSTALAAAGALLDSASLPARQVVLALLAGNVVASPMRAVRHQFPFYAGVFRPRLAGRLIVYNQIFRTGSIIMVALFYYFLTL